MATLEEIEIGKQYKTKTGYLMDVVDITSSGSIRGISEAGSVIYRRAHELTATGKDASFTPKVPTRKPWSKKAIDPSTPAGRVKIAAEDSNYLKDRCRKLMKENEELRQKVISLTNEINRQHEMIVERLPETRGNLENDNAMKEYKGDNS